MLGVVNKSTQKDQLGKYQKIVSIVFFTFCQIGLHGPIWILIVTALTLNLNLVLLLVAVTFLQLPVRRSQTYINFINKYLKPFKYFKHYEIIFEETITSPNKCLFGVHPHSVFGLSLLSLMNSMKEGPLSNMVGLSSRFILNFPITGAFLKLWGIEAVNHTNIKRLMSNGKNIGILPGGFEEATITSAEEMRCWIENRKGFIKYALDFGYTIYPVMMMNQHKAYSTFDYWLKFRLWLNQLKFPGVLFWNKWTGVLLPPWLSLHLIIGRGICVNLKEGETVTKELIDQTHKAYVAEIMRIYEKYAYLNDNCPIKIY